VGSRLVGNRGQVLSFEPVDKTFDILSRNIVASNVDNVQLHKLGLSNQNLKTTFNISSHDGIGGSSSQGFHKVVEFDIQQEVEIVPLDRIIKTDNRVSLIKIDIEGGELYALQGMEQLLRAQQPDVTFEWNFLTAQAMGYQPDDIITFLESLNYKIRIVDNKNLIVFEKNKYPKERVLMLWASINPNKLK
jgi:FkbM family methyltransferase